MVLETHHLLKTHQMVIKTQDHHLLTVLVTFHLKNQEKEDMLQKWENRNKKLKNQDEKLKNEKLF